MASHRGPGFDFATTATDQRSAVAVVLLNSTGTEIGAAAQAASGAAVAGNPTRIGLHARSSDLTAVSNDQTVDAVGTLDGKQLLQLYALPQNFISATVPPTGGTTDITNTTATTIFAAQGSGIKSYVASIVIQNANASVGGWVGILDATTTIHQVYCAPGGGGEALSLPVPLAGSANAVMSLQCQTTGMNVRASLSGYKGT